LRPIRPSPVPLCFPMSLSQQTAGEGPFDGYVACVLKFQLGRMPKQGYARDG